MCTSPQSQVLTNKCPEATPPEKHLLYSLLILTVYLVTFYLNQLPSVQSESIWVEAAMFPIEGMNLKVKEKK